MKKSRYGLGRWLGAGLWPVKRVGEMLIGVLPGYGYEKSKAFAEGFVHIPLANGHQYLEWVTVTHLGIF